MEPNTIIIMSGRNLSPRIRRLLLLLYKYITLHSTDVTKATFFFQ